MERNENYYNRNYNQRSDNNMDQFRDRYSQRGNYYGMPDNNHEYRNVRMQQRSDFNDFSEGPVGGYGAGNYNANYNKVHRNRDDHYRYGDDRNYSQGGMGRGDYRSESYRNRNRHENDNYSRGQKHGSGYDVAGNRQYARQENSYEHQGQGRRYSEYGRDERRNYGHELTDIHHDRGEFNHSRHDNDYRSRNRPDNRFDFDDNKEDFRYSGRIENSGSGRNRDDNYATGLYASNRAYVSDHSDSDGDRYSSRERRDHPSGPDYSKRSPIGTYGYDTYGI